MKKIIIMLLSLVMVFSMFSIASFARNCEDVTISDTELWDDGSLKSMNVTFDWGAAGNEHLYVVVFDEHSESNEDEYEYWFQYDYYSHTDVNSIEKSIADFAAYRGIEWYAFGGDGSTPDSGYNTINVTFGQGKVMLNVDHNYSLVMFNAPDGTNYRPTDPLGTLKCASSGLSFENTSGESADVEIEDQDDDNLIATNEDGETVEPGPDTYEVKEDGIHIYDNDVIFSGKTSKNFIIENDWQVLNLDDITIDHDLIIDGPSEEIYVYTTDTAINGDVIVKNDSDEAILNFGIYGDNTINGNVTVDGSLSVYSMESDATLSVNGVEASDSIYFYDIRFENLKDEYEEDVTKKMEPADETKPIRFIAKTEVFFPEQEEFIINGGKPFAFGAPLDIETPVVKDKDGDALEPQPELDVTFYKYGDENEFMFDLVEGTPTEVGRYAVVFSIPEDNPYYTGFEFYDFAIEKTTEPEPVPIPETGDVFNAIICIMIACAFLCASLLQKNRSK